MRFSYRSEQWLPHPVELVFAFFANPENLPRLMPTWQKARIEEAAFRAPPPRPAQAPRFASIAAGEGSKLTMSFRPFPHCPVRLPWEAEITEFAWNDHFCDRQVRGPFAYWNHCHKLVAKTGTDAAGVASAGTLLLDDVDYEVPFGVLGAMAQRVFIARQLAATFAYRKQRTSELLGMIGPGK